MIVEVDIGNSRIKWRRWADGTIADRGVASHEPQSWAALAPADGKVSRVRISNVAGAALAARMGAWVAARWGVKAEFAVSRATAAGVTSGYLEPETLGVDRWLGVLAAWRRVAGPCVVVDAGSAITLDLIADHGRHQGGYIVPGLRMMQRALFAGTSGVRVDGEIARQLNPGATTREAVANGCLAMAVAVVERARGELGGKPVVILTGGDGAAIYPFITGARALVPELVLDGLALALP